MDTASSENDSPPMSYSANSNLTEVCLFFPGGSVIQLPFIIMSLRIQNSSLMEPPDSPFACIEIILVIFEKLKKTVRALLSIKYLVITQFFWLALGLEHLVNI